MLSYHLCHQHSICKQQLAKVYVLLKIYKYIMLTAATKVFIYIIQLLIRLYSKYLVNIKATKVYTDYIVNNS